MRWQQVEAELRAQVAALQAAVEEKDKDMRTVMATVDRLQKTPSGFRQSGDISAKKISAFSTSTSAESGHVLHSVLYLESVSPFSWFLTSGIKQFRGFQCLWQICGDLNQQLKFMSCLHYYIQRLYLEDYVMGKGMFMEGERRF